MKKLHSSTRRMALLTALTALALAACGGGDDAPSTTGLLAGTAATGAPIAGGKVDVACASGAPLSAMTSATGTFEVALQGQTLPCKLKVSGGTLAAGVAYHSVALQPGTVNLTPLTDLVVARMHSGAPSAWFSAISAADFQKITADAVNTALGAITSGLSLATALGGKNPMTAAFEAKTTDPLDKVLEALKSAAPSYATLLTAAQGASWNSLAQSYVAAINAFLAGSAAGGTSPTAPAGGGTTPTVSLGACPANPTPGTYSMVVETTVSGLGSVPVPAVCINNIATKPATQDSFCGDASIKQALPAGTLTIESCTYDAAAGKGTIAAKITTPVTIGYTVTYTFVKR